MSSQNNSSQKPVEQPKRPQEPQLPYSYHEEEVYYDNKEAGITLAGTLTLPNINGTFPSVLLIAGYGPHDRNVTGMGHKLFLVLADYLTKKGIAVLRFDKRGVGASTGVYATATSEDFASDVRAGVTYLQTRKEIKKDQIGLIGISEGGLIASMVAAQSKDIAFIVLMAPAVLGNIDDMVEMTGLQLKADGASSEFISNDKELRKSVYSIVKQEADYGQAEKQLKKVVERYLAQLPEEQKKEAESLPFAFTEAKASVLISVFNSPWYHFFLGYDPSSALKQIKIPVLAVNGDCDWIATLSKVFAVLTQAFKQSGHTDYTLVELPKLNHMFQTCTTGALKEYATSEETIAPVALKTLSDWITSTVA